MTERATDTKRDGQPTLVNDLRAMGAILNAIAAGRQTLNRDAIPDMAQIAAEGAAEIERVSQDRLNDLHRLVRALGLPDVARPESPAQVFEECLREAERLRAQGEEK